MDIKNSQCVERYSDRKDTELTTINDTGDVSLSHI